MLLEVVYAALHRCDSTCLVLFFSDQKLWWSIKIYIPFPCRAASLKSGNLHPDAVVHREQSLKAENSAYYLELHRYHNEYGDISAVKIVVLHHYINYVTFSSSSLQHDRFFTEDEGKMAELQ